jgi:transcription antitermination factor NusG
MYEDYWRVLHVIANHEKRVAQHLTAHSIEHYLPLYPERSRWTDRWVTVERPLFTGYVFVRFSREARLDAISTPGVIHLLGDKIHQTVNPEEIERIRTALAQGCSLRPHPAVDVGTLVRVKRGIFENAMGIATELRRQCKVVIALSGSGQCFALEVDLDDVDMLQTPIGDHRAESHQRTVAAHAFPRQNASVLH